MCNIETPQVDPSQYSIRAYSNDDLFNLFFVLFFQYKPEYYKGSYAFNYQDQPYLIEYDVGKPPSIAFGSVTAMLAADDVPPNVAIKMPQYAFTVYTYDGGQKGNKVVEASGSISLFGAIYMKASQPDAATAYRNASGTATGIPGGGVIDQDFLQHVLVVQIGNLTEEITLPQMNHILGTDLDADVTYVEIAPENGNYLLNVYADVDKSPTGADANRADDTAPVGHLGAQVSATAINTVFNALLDNLEYDFKEAVAGTGVKGSVKVTGVQFDLADGKATAGIKIRVKIYVGILGGWIGVPTLDASGGAKVSLDKIKDGQAAQLRLYGFAVLLHFKWPRIIEHTIGGLLDAIADLVTNVALTAVSGWLEKKTVVVYDLPDLIPGTDVPVALSFEKLGFDADNVQTQIKAVERPAARQAQG